MKNRIISIIMIMTITLSLVGCGSKKGIDSDNKNIYPEQSSITLTGTDIYYSVSSNMKGYLDVNGKQFKEIVYAAASVARDTWHKGDTQIYKVKDEPEKCSEEFLEYALLNKEEYSDSYHKSLNTSLKQIDANRMNIIITDLQSELDDYSGISRAFVENALSKDLSIGFIGVELEENVSESYTFFIIAISDNENLMKYMNNFKENPTIMNYSGQKTDFQVDRDNLINYQIIAKNSGILNIDYDNIQIIENGFWAGEDGNINQQEIDGSFTKLNEGYKEEHLNTEIEGTVNFTPNVVPFVKVRAAKTRGKGNSEKKTGKYIGVKSLVYDEKAETAGKVKVEVPFNIIGGVKLSKIQCDLSAVTYNGQKSFREATDSDVRVTLAKAATPEQGKWRVDDAKNSVTLNVMVPNAGKFTKSDEFMKLDITFKHNDTMESVSNWVKSWEKRGCTNIMNLFNSLYTYQKDANVAENSLTLYLAPGEEKLTKRFEQRSER